MTRTAATTCLVDDCQKPAGVPGTARGWCSTHYHRWKSTGDPLLTLSDLKPKPSPTCSVDGCDWPRWARGYCATHYQRWRARGVAGPAEREWTPAIGRCSVRECRRSARKKGLCQRHYLRLWRHGDPRGGNSLIGTHTACSVADCGREHYGRGLCHAHWQVIAVAPRERARRLGLPVIGECTPRQLIARLDVFANRCWMCRQPAGEVDHVKPLSAGGSQWPANLRPACQACNTAKNSQWPFDLKVSA